MELTTTQWTLPPDSLFARILQQRAQMNTTQEQSNSSAPRITFTEPKVRDLTKRKKEQTQEQMQEQCSCISMLFQLSV